MLSDAAANVYPWRRLCGRAQATGFFLFIRQKLSLPYLVKRSSAYNSSWCVLLQTQQRYERAFATKATTGCRIWSCLVSNSIQACRPMLGSFNSMWLVACNGHPYVSWSRWFLTPFRLRIAHIRADRSCGDDDGVRSNATTWTCAASAGGLAVICCSTWNSVYTTAVSERF